jgi:hypothetical protein
MLKKKKTPARMLGTAALAVTMSLGTATSAAFADDGHDDGRAGHHGGDSGDWSGHRDGHRHGWSGHRDGDGGQRVRHWSDRSDDEGAEDSAERGAERGDDLESDDTGEGDDSSTAPSEPETGDDTSDGPSNASQGGFEQRRAALVAGFTRIDARLAASSERIGASNMDPTVRDAVLGMVNAYRTKVADLTAQAKAATRKDDLRAIHAEFRPLAPWIFYGWGSSMKQARMAHAA